MDSRRGSDGARHAGTCGLFSEFIIFAHSIGILPRDPTFLIPPQLPSLSLGTRKAPGSCCTPTFGRDMTRFLRAHSNRHLTGQEPWRPVAKATEGVGARIRRSDWMILENSFWSGRPITEAGSHCSPLRPRPLHHCTAPSQPRASAAAGHSRPEAAAGIHGPEPLPAELRLT